MVNKNKRLGDCFENEFATLLKQHGWWVHLLTQTKNGQPADLIAVKNSKALLVDCKVCTNNRFVLSRVEPNQHMAMDYWKTLNNGETWFALKLTDNTIVMLAHSTIKSLSIHGKSLNFKTIIKYGLLFEDWIKICG